VTVSHHALPYRRDIDGLRAIAVLAVVAYHFGLPGVPGGFVGVDVFFVLSGFLIGGLLWREQEATGRIALGAFYLRRIRRLAPAFVAMALVSAAVAWQILLPFEFREFGKQLIAATVYLSNVFFWREAGYFDSASEEKPWTKPLRGIGAFGECCDLTHLARILRS
jgi:peptidoglycan/LPS O-acetylase OafA/YrhL